MDIEKLKALALAAKGWTPPAPYEEDRSYSDREIRGLEFCAEASPAAVLELIAEVERLRAFINTECRGFTCWHDEEINKVLVAPAQPAVERRRDLAHAKLPLDAEVALEHAAIALDRAGQQQAHQQVIQVLAAHLPLLDGEDTEGGSLD
jgi:hypothetical protein